MESVHWFKVDVDLERYAIECWCCQSLTWFDYDEQPGLICTCWRCGEIVNSEL